MKTESMEGYRLKAALNDLNLAIMQMAQIRECPEDPQCRQWFIYTMQVIDCMNQNARCIEMQLVALERLRSKGKWTRIHSVATKPSQ